MQSSRCFTQHKPHAGRRNQLPGSDRTPSPAATEWSRLLLRDVVCSERVAVRRAAERTIPSLPGRVMGVHSVFLSLVTLTFNLDIQTRPSEKPTRLRREFGANLFSCCRDI